MCISGEICLFGFVKRGKEMQSMKRFIAILLAVFAVMAILPMSALAATTYQFYVQLEFRSSSTATSFSNNYYVSGSSSYTSKASSSGTAYMTGSPSTYTTFGGLTCDKATSTSSGTSGYVRWKITTTTSGKNFKDGLPSALATLGTPSGEYHLCGYYVASGQSTCPAVSTTNLNYHTTTDWATVQNAAKSQTISRTSTSATSDFFIICYEPGSGSGGGTTTQPTTYVSPAFLNGSSYTASANYYKSGSTYYAKVGGTTASTTNYDVKFNQTYTAGTGTTVTNGFSAGTNSTSKWTVTKTSGTLNATDAIPTSESSIMPGYSSGWKLIGYYYGTTAPGSTLPTMTSVSSYSDLRTKLSGQSATSTQAKYLILYFAKPVEATIRHWDNTNNKLIGDETIYVILNQPYSLVPSSAASFFNHDDYTYSFLKWEKAWGTMTFSNTSLDFTTTANISVTVTAADSTMGIRINCYWTVSEQTKPDYKLTIVTTVDGVEVASHETYLRESTGSQQIAPDKTNFNTAAYTYTFRGWTLTSGSVTNAENETTTFTMGKADAVATAEFTTTSNNNPGTGTGTNPSDGEFSIKFYVLYVDESYNLGYNYADGWNVYYNCQDHYCTHVNATSHSMARSIIRTQMANAVVAQGWELVGWTKTASANPTIWSAEGNENVTITVGNQIFLVAKKMPLTISGTSISTTYPLSRVSVLAYAIGNYNTYDPAVFKSFIRTGSTTIDYLTGDTEVTVYTKLKTRAADEHFYHVTIHPIIPGVGLNNDMIVATTNKGSISAMWVAKGHYTSYPQMKADKDTNGFKNVSNTLQYAPMTSTNEEEYSCHFTMNDGASYWKYINVPANALPEIIVEADGMTVYAAAETKDYISGMWAAKGHYESYGTMKAERSTNGFAILTSSKAYTFKGISSETEVSVYFTDVKGDWHWKYFTLNPEFSINVTMDAGVVTVAASSGVFSDVVSVHYASGHCTSYATMKAAAFFKTANQTHSFAPDFATYGNEFTVRVITSEGNELYWSVFADGTVTAR